MVPSLRGLHRRSRRSLRETFRLDRHSHAAFVADRYRTRHCTLPMVSSLQHCTCLRCTVPIRRCHRDSWSIRGCRKCRNATSRGFHHMRCSTLPIRSMESSIPCLCFRGIRLPRMGETRGHRRYNPGKWGQSWLHMHIHVTWIVLLARHMWRRKASSRTTRPIGKPRLRELRGVQMILIDRFFRRLNLFQSSGHK
jgi:hypothetical protein